MLLHALSFFSFFGTKKIMCHFSSINLSGGVDATLKQGEDTGNRFDFRTLKIPSNKR
jgi:hypothetical protein